MVKVFNPFTRTLDEVGPESLPQEYEEFVFNSGATQAGRVYSSWSDLITLINGMGNPKCRITLEQTESVALGSGINMDNITLAGNGTPVISGGVQFQIASGTIASWDNGVVEAGLGFLSNSASNVMTGSFTLTFNDGSAVAALGGTPMFSHSTGTMQLSFNNGSQLFGATIGGSTVIEKTSSGTVLLLSGSNNCNIDNDIVTGTSGIVEVIMADAGSANLTSNTQSGFSGTFRIKRLSKATNVLYDDTNIQTPTSGLVQADNVQEVVDDFITIFGPAVTTLYGRVPPAGGTTGQVLTKDTATDYDFSWQDSSGGSTGYAQQDYEKTTTYVYVGYEETGGAWYIYRRIIATNVRMYATGASGYAAAWTARSSLTYS